MEAYDEQSIDAEIAQFKHAKTPKAPKADNPTTTTTTTTDVVTLKPKSEVPKPVEGAAPSTPEKSPKKKPKADKQTPETSGETPEKPKRSKKDKPEKTDKPMPSPKKPATPANNNKKTKKEFILPAPDANESSETIQFEDAIHAKYYATIGKRELEKLATEDKVELIGLGSGNSFIVKGPSNYVKVFLKFFTKLQSFILVTDYVFPDAQISKVTGICEKLGILCETSVRGDNQHVCKVCGIKGKISVFDNSVNAMLNSSSTTTTTEPVEWTLPKEKADDALSTASSQDTASTTGEAEKKGQFEIINLDIGSYFLPFAKLQVASIVTKYPTVSMSLFVKNRKVCARVSKQDAETANAAKELLQNCLHAYTFPLSEVQYIFLKRNAEFFASKMKGHGVELAVQKKDGAQLVGVKDTVLERGKHLKAYAQTISGAPVVCKSPVIANFIEALCSNAEYAAKNAIPENVVILRLHSNDKDDDEKLATSVLHLISNKPAPKHVYDHIASLNDTAVQTPVIIPIKSDNAAQFVCNQVKYRFTNKNVPTTLVASFDVNLATDKKSVSATLVGLQGHMQTAIDDLKLLGQKAVSKMLKFAPAAMEQKKKELKEYIEKCPSTLFVSCPKHQNQQHSLVFVNAPSLELANTVTNEINNIINTEAMRNVVSVPHYLMPKLKLDQYNTDDVKVREEYKLFYKFGEQCRVVVIGPKGKVTNVVSKIYEQMFMLQQQVVDLPLQVPSQTSYGLFGLLKSKEAGNFARNHHAEIVMLDRESITVSSYHVNSTKLFVVFGDFLKVRADCYIVPALPTLQSTSGIASYVMKHANSYLKTEYESAVQSGPLLAGTAHVTTGALLNNSATIINAVADTYVNEASIKHAEAALVAALESAKKQDCKSICITWLFADESFKYPKSKWIETQCQVLLKQLKKFAFKHVAIAVNDLVCNYL